MLLIYPKYETKLIDIAVPLHSTNMSDTMNTPEEITKPKPVCHAWYSPTQHARIFERRTSSKKRAEIAIWARANGERVVATAISCDKNYSGCEYDDMKYRGEVVKWVGSCYDAPEGHSCR